MDTQIVVWMMIAGLAFVMLVFFLKPIKHLTKFLISGVLGGIGMYAVNILLAPIGLGVGINLLTLFIVAVLGLPGFILLYGISWFL